MLAGTRNLQPIDNPIGTRLSTHVSGTICYPCLRSGQCPTGGVGRTRTMFHNTLVVGSSPTSSTTQSHILEISRLQLLFGCERDASADAGPRNGAAPRSILVPVE